MIRACFCLLAGVLALQLSSFPPRSDQWLVLIVALIIVLPRIRRRDLLLVLSGALYFWLHAAAVIEARLDAGLSGDSLLVDVRVVDFPRTAGETISFTATPVIDARLPARLALHWYRPPVSVRLGDVWRMELRLKRPRGNSNPSSMDAEAWLFRRRIGAAGYVVSGRHNRLLDSDTTVRMMRIRQNFATRLQRLFGDQTSASVLAAIVVGSRHLLSREQWRRYSQTGTSHLMAISGLHVGMAAIGAYFLLRGILGIIGLRRSHHEISLVTALFVAALYVSLSGFAVPAQRAISMLLFATVSLTMQRQIDPARVLAASAIVIMGIDPLATMAAGFKLSFAAVMLLYWLARRRARRRASCLWRPVAALRDLAVLQALLLAGLLPLTVLMFDRLSLVAPLINLVAVPLFGLFTVPLALAGLILDGPLAVLGDALLHAAAASIDGLDRLIAVAAAMPRSAIRVAEISRLAWFYLLLPLTWALLPPGWPGRAVAWCGLLALCFWRPAPGPADCVDIDMLDVGQGLAIVVRVEARVLLYDTGPLYRGGGSAAERILLPYFAGRGIDRIDTLVVSHSDLDHAGGAQVLLDALPIETVLSGDELEGLATTSRPCVNGMFWIWSGVRFSIVHPETGATKTGNDASCVLLIETGVYKALLTGDIEAGVETTLIEQRRLPQVDLVTIPHHGSRTSSITPFVQALTPGLALVSAANGNQWGFPKPDVVARWQAGGAAVLNTGTSGAISVRMCRAGGLSSVKEYRKERRRVWTDDDSYAAY